jgi:hypothetical protein
MDIMSLFRSNPSVKAPEQQAAAPNQQQQTPGTPGNLPSTPPEGTANTTGTAANGAVPANANDQNSNDDSPLAKFQNMWEPVTNSEGQTEDKPLDVNQLQEIVKQADFSKVLNQDNLKAISEGGEGAIAAFQDSLNSVAQQVLLQSTLANDRMIETKVASALNAHKSELPNLIRNQAASNEMNLKNPIFKNPAVKPVIEAVTHQLAAKNPDATPFELVEMANNFVTAMSEAFAPKQQSQPNSKIDVDWESFMNS